MAQKEIAMLFDSSRCTGCKGCQVACKQWNMLPSPMGLNENVFHGSYQNPPNLNGDTRLVMTFDEKPREQSGDASLPEGDFQEWYDYFSDYFQKENP